MFEQALDTRTILLIKTLAQHGTFFENFYLAGGTALSLHLGHRRSEDIDLFAEKQFSINYYSDIISSIGGRILIAEQGTIHCILDEVKLSLFYYPYPLLNPVTEFFNIKIASIADIACMKAVAISQRAEKKDFFDLIEILKILSPAEVKNILYDKFGQNKINLYHIVKSFFYFSDVEDSPDPISLTGITWEKVKDYLISREKEISSIFLTGTNCA
ncbi:conserved hypothetical protein [uncultured Desulfobacterium sp.]|uniref:Nucleotidyl transferase AbiEii/AbiGii toxin family protein n=1 Tax=uncultured Desulfobacterium sp. TaxID=201089 RepID=A0A445MX89_9BACT|nr:conserved hypothetical protein [uncultured Desulfobacterium sp.]